MKKIFSILVATAMLLSFGTAFAKSTYSDTLGHWAEKQIESWSNHGVISGYDGNFSPDRSITRGEFAVVLNRLMTYEKTAENSFTDLGQEFFTDSVLKLNKAGVMQGYDNKISPKDSLTREEAAIMICRALGIEQQDSVNKSFSDYSSVSSWAKGYMNAAINLGLINGADGKLNPKNTITRAEVVTILDNAVMPVLSSGEILDVEINKILVISASDVTIKNATINGRIIITQGVKDGDISFVDSEINGEVVIDNERSEFISLDNTTVKNESLTDNDAFMTGGSEDKKDENKEDNKEDSKDDGGGSSGPGGGSKDDKDDNEDVTPETPENPETPDNPNTPTDPENPDEPDEPDAPVVPDEPDEPDVPDEPVVPDEPDEPDTPTEPEKDADYYLTANAVMIEKLESASADIANYLTPAIPENYSVFTNEEKYILRTVRSCMLETLKYKDKEIIDSDFIKEIFAEEINDLLDIYNGMEEEGRSGAFVEKMAINLQFETIEWLAEYFGLLDK